MNGRIGLGSERAVRKTCKGSWLGKAHLIPASPLGPIHGAVRFGHQRISGPRVAWKGSHSQANRHWQEPVLLRMQWYGGNERLNVLRQSFCDVFGGFGQQNHEFVATVAPSHVRLAHEIP